MSRSARLQAAALHAVVVAFLLSPSVRAQDASPAPPTGSTTLSLNVRDCGASGSEYETTASATEGSKQITVANVGDFQVGQGVIVSRCNIRYESPTLWGPGEPYGSSKALKDEVEFRGYDGTAGSWIVYLLEVDGANPPTFRWSDDPARLRWDHPKHGWTGEKVPLTFDWQKLSGGTEVKFKHMDWQPGHMVTLSARDQLVSVIDKIEGNVLTLRHAANRTAKDALVRHNDQAALQATIDRAIREKRNVCFPAGYYRLAGSLYVRNAAIIIEGQSGVNTVLDISDGQGSCFSLVGGPEVTVRNFRMVGHTGLADAFGSFRTSSGFGFWACAVKGCNAVGIQGTERTLIQNVHASRMASECFYSQAPCRTSTTEPKQYQKSLIYDHCSVTDCAANGFNNNDTGENTSVLYCRINGVGWHAWEGPARFIRLIGNYVRNAGPFTIGDMSSRPDDLHNLGCGQAIVTDNVFESVGNDRSEGIVVNHGATQVVIAHNLFVNYNGTAITASSFTVSTSYPSNTISILGNMLDMTSVSDKPTGRTGIVVSASGTVVADNQVYVRGACDPRVTGLSIAEPALNVDVHDNVIRNCNVGLKTGRAATSVAEVVDPSTFHAAEGGVPFEWRTSHLYRGWTLVWLVGSKPTGTSTIDAFDPVTCRFKLKEPHDMKPGDRFEVFPPTGANWDLHDNTISGCREPVVLDSYGSETSLFRNNTIARGDTPNVPRAVVVAGRFDLLGNRISGFDEPSSAALVLRPDRVGRALRNLFRDNLIERCFCAVDESSKPLWDAAVKSGNQFLGCGQDLAGYTPRPQITPGLAAAAHKPILHARKLTTLPVIDGDVKEWPWSDAARVGKLELTPTGEPIASPHAQVCAGWAGTNLYVALRCDIPKGVKLAPALQWQGDGMEVSFRSGDPKNRTPIFILWGSAGGGFNSSDHGGASAQQVQRLEHDVSYAARIGQGVWTCEWRIPLAEFGLNPTTVKKLLFNAGVRSMAQDLWLSWAPTGGALYEVDNGGELVFD